MTVIDGSPVPLSEQVVEEIRVAMTRKRVSGRELARRLEVSPPWISYRLTGETAISVADVERIAAALGVPIGQLLPVEPAGGRP